jgi:putative oxidoreductase
VVANEFNLLIAATAIALAITGPGEISIDHLAGWTLAGLAWGLGALAISAAAAGSVLALRKPRPEQERDEKSRDEVSAT